MTATTPNWEHWLRQDLWTLREAVWLILGIEPGKVLPNDESQPEEFLDIERAAIISQKAGKLQTLNDTVLAGSKKHYREFSKVRPENPYTRGLSSWNESKSERTTIYLEEVPYGTTPDRNGAIAVTSKLVETERNIIPEDFISWATRKGYNIPKELTSFNGGESSSLHLEMGNRNPEVTARKITAWYLRNVARKNNQQIAEIMYPGEPYPGEKGSIKASLNRDKRDASKILGISTIED